MRKMTNRKRVPGVGAPKDSCKDTTISQYLSNFYYITIIMAVTTLIAGWHIDNVWDGIVTMICGMVTIWMSYVTARGFKG